MTDVMHDRVVVAVGDLYDVQGELGRGGMALVYRAIDRRLKRPVALKVLPPELAFREEVRRRFMREAETSAKLNYQNIVPIYSVDPVVRRSAPLQKTIYAAEADAGSEAERLQSAG